MLQSILYLSAIVALTLYLSAIVVAALSKTREKPLPLGGG